MVMNGRLWLNTEKFLETHTKEDEDDDEFKTYKRTQRAQQKYTEGAGRKLEYMKRKPRK